jgi:hypothetical protein
MTIFPIKTTEGKEACHTCFKKIFFEPYEENNLAPFTSQIERRDFLYPVPYVFNKILFSALEMAAATSGDTMFLLSNLDNVVDENPDWIISLNYQNYLEFQKISYVSENAIYSPKGEWGIVFYDDGRAVIGGSNNFIESFFNFLPLETKGNFVSSFLHDYKKEQKACLEFLSYLYGLEQALSLMDTYIG